MRDRVESTTDASAAPLFSAPSADILGGTPARAAGRPAGQPGRDPLPQSDRASRALAARLNPAHAAAELAQAAVGFDRSMTEPCRAPSTRGLAFS